jgi:DNA-nicking Smr family endonuclease
VEDEQPSQEPMPLPIDGVLDLHTFRPEELGALLPAYLTECRTRGILEVRIIHGKGIGNVKRSVRAILSRLPEVVTFSDASQLFGGTGATIVNLRPPPHS